MLDVRCVRPTESVTNKERETHTSEKITLMMMVVLHLVRALHSGLVFTFLLFTPSLCATATIQKSANSKQDNLATEEKGAEIAISKNTVVTIMDSQLLNVSLLNSGEGQIAHVDTSDADV